MRKTDLFYADIDDKYAQNISVEDYISNAVTLFPYKVNTHKVEQVLKYAHVEAQSDTPICELPDEVYARILFHLPEHLKQVLLFLIKYCKI